MPRGDEVCFKVSNFQEVLEKFRRDIVCTSDRNEVMVAIAGFLYNLVGVDSLPEEESMSAWEAAKSLNAFGDTTK